MDDFYVTIPYGLVVLGGGIAGYVKRGSAASLAAGAGFGGALLLAGALSIWAFASHSRSLFATVLQTVCAAALTIVMGIRYMKTRKVMPAGIVAMISALALIFYVYKISNGGNEVYFPVTAE
ncbi:protein FATTY ACID EXPORT 6-like [Lolium rigidum]|uniref:protein FATTY ACID EXPORT 6-like n=1 Tax=Lolium rigidum TaxID=89674 RepID=UPI001F5DB763|nr:protein FATTY ACID EXPORT 6-like [Lolium rigidum]